MEVGYPTSSTLGSYGIGFNRRTCNLGRAIGQVAKRGLKSYFSNQKKRKASSSTRTSAKRRKTTGYGYQIPTGGGDSKSTFSLVNPMVGQISPVLSELPPSTVVNDDSGRHEAAVGGQQAVLVADYYSAADITKQFTLLNPATSAKIFLKSVRGETLITNQENVNGRFTIYDIIARKDTDSTCGSPYDALTTGGGDNTSGANTDYLIAGCSVYSNPRFTAFFKVLQETKVVLSPGACHTHQVTYKPNMYFSQEVSKRIGGTGIGDLTLYTLDVFHGTPINDVTTQTQVSLSHIAMDYVHLEEYKCQYILQGATNIDTNVGIPQSFSVAGNTMQDDGVELAANEA